MSKIQITSTEPPFDRATIAAQAARVIAQADAMGLLNEIAITRLDMPLMRTVAGKIAAAGIGREVQATLATDDKNVDLEALLGRLAQALDESPVPAFEWAALTTLFEPETLGALLNVSPASLRRYSSGERKTPDAVAERLHFLATLVGLLAGAYNEVGIRRWFERRRSQLGGAMPAALLSGDWSPDDPGPQRVRRLAEALLDAGVT